MPHDLLNISAFCHVAQMDRETLVNKTTSPLVYDKTLYRQRAHLPFLMDLCQRRLSHINPASFAYLSQPQIQALEKELLLIQYIYKAQLTIDDAEQRRQTKQALSEKINTCTNLLDRLLNQAPVVAEPLDQTPEDVHAALLNQAPNHCRFLGMTIVAPELINQLRSIHNAPGKTVSAKSIIREINIKRLYWVFTGSFLSSLIAALPEHVAQRQQAQNMVSAPSPYTGVLSWGLYYTRFSVELGLLLKHTIKGPWMNQAEKDLGISTYERFKTQWAQRKYMLMNDSLWATANLLCYFWLIGNGNLGYAGNLLTGALFTFDTMAALWRFEEEKTLHNKMIQDMNDKAELLRAQINQNNNENETNLLKIELKKIEADQKHMAREWRYKKYGLINDCAYSIGLIIGIAGICALFLPPAALLPATLTMLSVVGAGICYSMSLLYTIINGQLDIAKEKNSANDIKKEYNTLLKDFRTETNESLKKQIYLDILSLEAKTQYQERLINFKRMELVRSVITDVIFPASVLIAGLMLSTGAGIGVLLGVIVLSFAIKKIIQQFEPKAPELASFDEDDYQAFSDEQKAEHEVEVENAELGENRAYGLFQRRNGKRNEAAPLIDERQPRTEP